MPPKPWTPNDWNLDYCRLRQALALLPKKADGSYAWGALKIAHLDTGYRRKKALGFASETGTGDSPWIKPSLGRDFLDNKPDPKDPLVETPWQPPGHGSRTSSALAGEDAAVGFKGLAPRLALVPYRVNEDSLIGHRSAKAIGQAIIDAIDQNGCPICAISLGFPVLDTGAMGEAVGYAYEKGVIVVGACGQMTDKVSYPAKHRRAIGVAGVKRLANGQHRIYYKYDSYARVDIFAPAQPIDRADADPDAPPYGKGDGTSYAVPHVVATAAIWLTLRGPEIKQKYGIGWKRIEAFRKLLRLTQRQLLFKAPEGCLARALDAEALVKAKLPTIEDWDYEEDRAADDRM
ncbi:MAG: S8/S53 family peptidase [Pseudomonadota bacterium]